MGLGETTVFTSSLCYCFQKSDILRRPTALQLGHFNFLIISLSSMAYFLKSAKCQMFASFSPSASALLASFLADPGEARGFSKNTVLID